MPKNLDNTELKDQMVRRDFLKLSSTVVATAALSACTNGANEIITDNKNLKMRALASTTPASGAQFVSVKAYGAVGDGKTDDTSAIQNANNAAASQKVALYFPAGTYAVTKTLQQTVSWIGEFGGQVNNSDNPAKIMKTNGNTNGSAVIQFAASNISCRYISCIVPNPPTYDMVTYPKGTAYSNNPSYGFYAAEGTVSQALLIYGCSASGFSVTGYYLGLGEVVCQIQSCDARLCATGIVVASTDCQVVSCTVRNNCGQGISVVATYARLLNNIVAWNAAEGAYVTGGEFIVNSNQFDRNGKAGLYVGEGWGGTVSANSFSRNGASGNGSVGRWAFSVPGNQSYAQISGVDSCHIKVFYQRDVAITGNTYTAGQSDSNDGVLSPAYVYSNAGANGGIVIGGNTGESTGYNSKYPGGAGTTYGGGF